MSTIRADNVNDPRNAANVRGHGTGGYSSHASPMLLSPPSRWRSSLSRRHARSWRTRCVTSATSTRGSARWSPRTSRWKKLGRPAATTIDTYERILARLAVSLPPGIGIAELSSAELSLYLNDVPPDSWKLHRTVINGFLEWAINYDHRTAKNPIKLLPRMQPGPWRTITVFTEREIDAIINAARLMDDPVRDHARAMLMVDTRLPQGRAADAPAPARSTRPRS